MASYEEVRVKLTNTQLNKLKCLTKNKTGTTLRITKKNFQDEELPHKLLLTTRQTIKVRNAFTNNMSTDIKLSKAKISKIIQSGGFLGSWLGKTIIELGKKVVTDLAIPFARDNLAGLVSSITSNTINKFEKEVNGKGDVRAVKGFTSFISNEDMNDIIKIIKSLEDSPVLIYDVTETVKHEIKKNKKVYLLVLC